MTRDILLFIFEYPFSNTQILNTSVVIKFFLREIMWFFRILKKGWLLLKNSKIIRTKTLTFCHVPWSNQSTIWWKWHGILDMTEKGTTNMCQDPLGSKYRGTPLYDDLQEIFCGDHQHWSYTTYEGKTEHNKFYYYDKWSITRLWKIASSMDWEPHFL